MLLICDTKIQSGKNCTSWQYGSEEHKHTGRRTGKNLTVLETERTRSKRQKKW